MLNDRTLDVRAALDSTDEKQLRTVIDAYSDRALWSRLARTATDSKTTAVAETALADLPGVTALQALAATNQLVTLMTGRRWITIMHGREDGASWAEIGEAMGINADAARSWYAEKVATQKHHLGDLHDSARAEAVL
jgi:hypothetical protein